MLAATADGSDKSNSLSMAAVSLVPAVLESTAAAAQRRINVYGRWHTPLHLDVMDGKFVTTKSFGIRAFMRLQLPSKTTVHLMVKNPRPWIAACQGRVSRIIIHVESDVVPAHLQAASKRLKTVVALNPGTPLSRLRPFVPYVSGVHVMTVRPGRQGARFLPKQLTVVKQIKRQYPRLPISVDGGMNKLTIPAAIKAGAREIVVGSALKHANRPYQTFRSLAVLVRARP